MNSYSKFGPELQTLLHLSKAPVAIAFDTDASGLDRSTDTVPSSCAFWTKALDRTFYTTPEQHQNCSIGAVTHGYRAAKDTLGGCGCADVDLLESVGWVGDEDIKGLPAIPQDKQRKIAYGPLAQAPFTPDVVLMFVNAGQAMLVAESTKSRKVLSKPTCQALPEAYKGNFVISLGCTASRLRVGYDDNEMVVAIPGQELEGFVQRLRVSAAADTKVAGAVG